jgi:hypothetical protein
MQRRLNNSRIKGERIHETEKPDIESNHNHGWSTLTPFCVNAVWNTNKSKESIRLFKGGQYDGKHAQ